MNFLDRFSFRISPKKLRHLKDGTGQFGVVLEQLYCLCLRASRVRECSCFFIIRCRKELLIDLFGQMLTVGIKDMAVSCQDNVSSCFSIVIPAFLKLLRISVRLIDSLNFMSCAPGRGIKRLISVTVVLSFESVYKELFESAKAYVSEDGIDFDKIRAAAEERNLGEAATVAIDTAACLYYDPSERPIDWFAFAELDETMLQIVLDALAVRMVHGLFPSCNQHGEMVLKHLE